MTFVLFALVICLVIQFLYWHVIFQRAAERISPVRDLEKGEPFLSVVICFHKKWDTIPMVLHSLRQQSYSNFEIILINDGPLKLDNTDHEQYLEKNERIRYLRHHKTRSGKKDALATGIEAAKAEWIVVTDIDCEPGQDWLQILISHIPDAPAILLGYSPYVSQKGLLNFVIRQETLLTAFQYLGWARAGQAYMGVGRNMVYHKSIYQKIKFDAHLNIPTGDDDLFVNEAARSYPVLICNERDSFVYSEPATSWTTWYHQKTRHKSGGKYYSPASKLRLALFLLSLILEKIILTYLIFVRIELFLLFTGLKILFTAGPLRKLYRKFSKAADFWKIWVYEWLHVVYLVIVAPYVFIITKQQWE